LTTEKPTRFLALILVAGFVLKLAAGWYLSDGFLSRGNSHTAMNALAINLIEHGEFSVVPGMESIDYEPAYPAMMGLGFLIFGTNWFGVLLLQALLHGATSWLLYRTGERLGNRSAGFVAAVMHAFYPFLFLHTLSIIDSTAFIFCVVLVIWSLLGCWNDGERSDFIWLGIGGGIALLTRGAFVALGPPFAAMFVAALWRHRSRETFAKATMCATIAFVLLGPWVVRNYRLCGKILISTHGPFGVWQGNNPHTLELLKNNISLDEVYRRDPPPEIYVRYPLQPRSADQAVEAAAAYKQQAMKFITEHPREFIELAAWKFIKFWSPFYNPVAKSYAFGGGSIRRVVYTTTYFPILLLAIPGAVVLWRQHRAGTLMLLGLIGFYTLAHMIAMGYSRLRLPLDPVLMVFAAHFLVAQFPSIRIHRSTTPP
jgi:4-amino-4-deoxy-L-arabinose transferase-like glycosyltransferase